MRVLVGRGSDIVYKPDGAVVLEGLDDAIVGTLDYNRLVYSQDKIVACLMRDSSMDREEAIEYMEFNILGLYAGETTPEYID